VSFSFCRSVRRLLAACRVAGFADTPDRRDQTPGRHAVHCGCATGSCYQPSSVSVNRGCRPDQHSGCSVGNAFHKNRSIAPAADPNVVQLLRPATRCYAKTEKVMGARPRPEQHSARRHRYNDNQNRFSPERLGTQRAGNGAPRRASIPHCRVPLDSVRNSRNGLRGRPRSRGALRRPGTLVTKGGSNELAWLRVRIQSQHRISRRMTGSITGRA